MLEFLNYLNGAIWGVPGVVLIALTGIYLTVRTGFSQFRMLPEALRAFLRQFKKDDNGAGVSGYEALCTALAATVGTGNLAGVAGAICLGGPGVILWLWIFGILGMIIKFAEATLSVKYRIEDGNGGYYGGPMYMIRDGMGHRWHWLGCLYCFFGVVASFGVGNATQVNAVLDCLSVNAESFGYVLSDQYRILIGLSLGVILVWTLKGGMKTIGKVTKTLVPVAAVGYILLCVIVLVIKLDALPEVFFNIIKGAFAPRAITGGVVGSLFVVVRIGAARGVFTNEAGMGTAAIAHASANVKNPKDQGLMGIVEVFVDTIVICTLTGLVILCSGVEIPYGKDMGSALTNRAFAVVLGEWSTFLISVFLILFAVATVIGWSYYGVRCAQYLFGDDRGEGLLWLQGGAALIGAIMGTGTVWVMADILNGLMMIPNLFVIISLSGVFTDLIKKSGADKVSSGKR